MSVGNLLGRFSASGEASMLGSEDELLLIEENDLLNVSSAASWMRDVQVLSHWTDLTLVKDRSPNRRG